MPSSYFEVRRRSELIVHYQGFENSNFLSGDNDWSRLCRRFSLVQVPGKPASLAQFETVVCNYMMSSDYTDALDAGMPPETDSQYWVAPFIQEIFSDVLETKRPDVASLIKKKTSMHLA